MNAGRAMWYENCWDISIYDVMVTWSLCCVPHRFTRCLPFVPITVPLFHYEHETIDQTLKNWQLLQRIGLQNRPRSCSTEWYKKGPSPLPSSRLFFPQSQTGLPHIIFTKVVILFRIPNNPDIIVIILYLLYSWLGLPFLNGMRNRAAYILPQAS